MPFAPLLFMKQNNISESFFGFEELFFSQTDTKGIIQSGNSVFQRVSEFAWDELINRPHNIIRHPDMPRGVFHLLWDYLKADKPIAAFVKNRSKSGKYYWVFALAMPVKNGYLSVRMKPGGELLEVIKREYENLRQIETSRKISPEESQALLLERIEELGFRGYSDFMSAAMAKQIEHRCQKLQLPLPVGILNMNELRAQSAEILKRTNEIMNAYQLSKFVPLNLELSAARLGDEGRQISAVASQYGKMVGDINQQIARFVSMSKEVTDRIEMGQFYIGASQLFEDAEMYLAQGAGDTGGSAGGTETLRLLSKQYVAGAKKAIQEILNVIRDFVSLSNSLLYLGSGLELVRISGRIENARMDEPAQIRELLLDLKAFQSVMSSGLRQILERNADMDRSSNQLFEHISRRG